jgi:hypothetical protein
LELIVHLPDGDVSLTQFALENGEKTIIIGAFARWPWSDHRDPTMVPATRLASNP